MDDRKYQIESKAIYINLMLLEDELTHFDLILSKKIQNIHDWIEKLRATRGVFLTLYNVRDASKKLRVQGKQAHSQKTRLLRKELEFANHVRNKGIGHLDTTLLKRSVQWNPFMFMEIAQQSKELRLADAHRTVIESCINSFIDNEGKQKVFGHEIDLMYPNDANEFYAHLKTLVDNSLDWITDSITILHSQIKFHTKDEIPELASLAGSTNFNLNDEQVLNYSEKESKIRLSQGLDNLRSEGFPEDIINELRKKYGI